MMGYEDENENENGVLLELYQVVSRGCCKVEEF